MAFASDLRRRRRDVEWAQVHFFSCPGGFPRRGFRRAGSGDSLALDRYETALRVIELLEQPLVDEGFELLDVRLFLGGGRLTVRVFVDRDGGVSLDGCATASRTAGMLLEEADLFPDAYVIEVSSPGVRRPLRTRAHFEAAVGENVVLKVSRGSRTKTWKGVLEAHDGTGLTLRTADDEEPQRFAAADVREANLDPEFDPQALIRRDRRKKKHDRREARRARRQERDGD